MAEILRQAKRRDMEDSDFSWVEDTLTSWRALAVFGGLVILEGLFLWTAAASAGGLTDTTGSECIAVGAGVLLLGALVAPPFGREYAWATLGAGGLAIALGAYLTQIPLVVTRDPTFAVTAVVVGGLSVLLLALIRAMQLGGRARTD